ncbi:MAG: FkbM family methyltransferase [Alphaproteobacteria bacterium]|nr:FkbM family methyltransferase [Alphaproteobacteria bacterium]
MTRYEGPTFHHAMTARAADPRTRLFQWVADRFPSPAIEHSLTMRRLWKTLFYLTGPRAPFVMRTARYRLWVDPAKRKDIARSILHRGCYEPIETAIVLARLGPGMTVIDVGANVGHYAMVAAAAVGPEGRVVAFEPDGENHAALAANLALNGFTQAKAERLALGAAPGAAILYRDEANRGGHSLAAANVQKPGGEIRVAMTTLDAYGRENLAGRRVGFVKIDVQGAEAEVLAGAADTLARDGPNLLVEFWPHGIRARGGEPMELVERMLGLGYRMAVIDRGHPGHVRPLEDIDALRRIDLSDPQAYANLLFTKDNAGR